MEKNMKRFFMVALVQLYVFGLLGSSVWTASGLTMFAFLFWHSDLSLDTAIGLAGFFPGVLPFACVFACGIGAFDLVLGLLKMPCRVMGCALVGLCSLGWLIFAFAPDTSRLFGINLLALCLLGAVPAALCSWLCREITEGRLASGQPFAHPHAG
jgi:hypothetical protein